MSYKINKASSLYRSLFNANTIIRPLREEAYSISTSQTELAYYWATSFLTKALPSGEIALADFAFFKAT